VRRPSTHYDHATSSETENRYCHYVYLFICRYPSVSLKVDTMELRIEVEAQGVSKLVEERGGSLYDSEITECD
jgi:hypothetical protein